MNPPELEAASVFAKEIREPSSDFRQFGIQRESAVPLVPCACVLVSRTRKRMVWLKQKLAILQNTNRANRSRRRSGPVSRGTLFGDELARLAARLALFAFRDTVPAMGAALTDGIEALGGEFREFRPFTRSGCFTRL